MNPSFQPSGPELSIVVPVFNSEGCLGELAKRLHDVLDNYAPFELIFVDDGSADGSWKVIRDLCRVDPAIKGLSLMKNSGQDNALMAGLNASRGHVVVIMDDDLQHDPQDIPNLHAACREGHHICYALFRTKKQAWWKNFGSWLNGKAAELLINKPPHVYLSPFQAIRREVVDEVVKYKGPYPYVQGLLLRLTSNVTQVDAEHHTRHRGSSNFTFFRSLRVFMHLATSFSVVPLRFAIFLGLFFTLLSFVAIPVYLVMHFVGGERVPGFTTLVLFNLLIGGLVLLSLGIIGEYLGRMYLTINAKPQFVIGEKLNI
ncbi:MAG: glycosyltransferase family 2 protein [Chthoniobacterales bacterium]|nr:glycosyltransferase family 2 protein [Chthoniobacterales bacterium]